MPQLHTAHQEGQRDRPDEAPATFPTVRTFSSWREHEAASRQVPTPARGRSAGKMRREASFMSATSSPVAPPALGAATSLSCRECGEQYPISPRYACEMCFGPLEVAYDFTGVTRESIQAGPANIWRYKQLLP